jgi:hypothetical protein
MILFLLIVYEIEKGAHGWVAAGKVQDVYDIDISWEAARQNWYEENILIPRAINQLMKNNLTLLAEI